MEIVTNLIASIIFAILGAGSYKYLYLPYKRRSNVLSWLSPLDFSADPVYMCYGLIVPGEPSKNFTVAQGDLSAITLAYRVLVENYGAERVRIQNCMSTEPHLDDVSNLLSISGPRWNSITERYMRALGSPLAFSGDRRALIFREPIGSTDIFLNEYRESGDPKVCYGIMLAGIVKRKGGRTQNVLICAGSNSFSTYGCTIFLDELRCGRSLRRMGLAELRNQPRWGMIVRVQNLSPETTEYRGLLPFEKAQLHVRAERVMVAAEFSESYA